MDTPYDAIPLDVVGSTQDEVRERYAGRPLLVTAERQIAGRGRRGATWVQAPRAVAASLGFTCDWPPTARPRLSLAAGLAVLAAVGGSIGLAWPNDLVVGDAKVGGLIAEAHGELVVIGLGLNLYWPAPISGAAALGTHDPGREVADGIAGRWAGDLLRRVGSGPDGWGLDEYREASVTLGREVVWEPGGCGTAAGIDVDGGLIVDTPRGRRVLRSGSVRHVNTRGPAPEGGGSQPSHLRGGGR